MFRPAHKRLWLQWGFTRFNRMFLHYHFQNILVDAPENPPNKKTLFLINHSTWWDPLLVFHLNDQIIRSDGYGMMQEDGLRRFPFFRSIGAYSVNSDNHRHLIESLRYSMDLLQASKTVWIFPQGAEQPLEKRPLEFFSGIAYLAQKCPDTNVVPISLYYALEHTKKPNAYITIGEPLDKERYRNLDRKSMTEHFEKKAEQQLDILRERVIHEDYEVFKKI
ncbi:1-acyl-sn-glycerol-3-phosphate acyltransferase [Halobacillus dabanensis]|uniref:1-acyl-sn-glycerol-3-phosphate acyltransferase n=1 Tax=Halobacillus dabanensis TaxID=240302 RepID=A0A1I3V5W5_HALDA|nr:lysophospholipid acyltransferase family protein [Halobacillus dabanensis]SFJ90542.1 1-acyl-sn-glycerol-3-phosphate acyltransferase [Halobacillus dabanensis]